MNLQAALLNPNGRIGPQTFWRGLIALIVLGIIIQFIQVYSPSVIGMIVGFLGLTLIYPYVVLFGKRLHDSGRSAWWFLLVLVIWGLLGYFLGRMMQNIFVPDMQEQMQIAAESGNLSAIMEVSRSVARQTFIPGLISGIAIEAAIGYMVASLKSEAGTNRFGPPEGGDVDVFD